MSSFEKLRPATVSGPGAAPMGPLGRITLDSRRPAGPSVFRDFGGAQDTPAGDPATEPSPEAAAAEPGEKSELQKANEAAYADGYVAGRDAATRELVADGEAFTKALGELARFRAGLLDQYQSELLALALGIARKVVQRELADNPEHWLGMIREAVRHALDREKIRIRVGPVLHRFLVEHLSTLRPMLDDVKELELVEDRALAENGCILESQYGDLDLGIDSQIGAIRAALTQGV